MKLRIMRSLDTQNQVAGYFLEEHKIVFHKGYDMIWIWLSLSIAHYHDAMI